MNRNLYRLVQNTLGQWVAVPEIASGKHKGSGLVRKAIIASFASLAVGGITSLTHAADLSTLPTPCSPCAGTNGVNIPFVSAGTVDFQKNAAATEAIISQIGKSAITNYQDFNIGAGKAVTIQQVTDFATHNLVKDATFNHLVQIHDLAPSIIDGVLKQGEGQHLNLMMINTNGIVFANGAQVDVNSSIISTLPVKGQFDNLIFTNNVDSSARPIAQFEGNTGFIKVLEGARITAGSGGSVVMIAPTVTNRGTIETSGGGQAILAAGNKVYLIANETKTGYIDNSLRGILVEVDNSNLADGEYDTANSAVPKEVTLGGKVIKVADDYDKLGNVTNLGSITAAKGNITMVGLAVNQMGRATATSTVNLNGSVYLYAKDTPANKATKEDAVIASTRTGRLTVGANSQTQVLPDLNDTKTVLQSEIDQKVTDKTVTPSLVRMVGRDINVQNSALIRVPSGEISLYALNDPSSLNLFNSAAKSDPFDLSGETPKENTHVYIGKDALIDVSGLSATKSVADNYFEFTLRSDELKDSPQNRDDLRLQKVWVDLTKGSPLVSNAADQKASMTVTLAESMTKGGQVNLKSTGEVVVDKNAQFNLAGGKVTYIDAIHDTSKLQGADGKLYAMETAPADVKYVPVGKIEDENGKATNQYVVTEKTLIKGYTEGKSAGGLNITASNVYFAGKVDGTTTTGINQALAGTPPAGASLVIKSEARVNSATALNGINQNLVIGTAPSDLNSGFKAGDNLSGGQQDTLVLDAGLFGANGFNRVSISAVKDVAVNNSVTLAQKGSIDLSGHNVDVNANIKAESGAVSLSAKNDSGVLGDTPHLTVAKNVSLDVSGGWYNDKLTGKVESTTKTINAGAVNLTAGSGVIELKSNSVIDVRGGGYLDATGKLKNGNGGDTTLSAWKIATDELLQQHFKSEALGKGGALSITAANVKIADIALSNSASADDIALSTLWLKPGFFQQGYSNYAVTGLSGIELTNGTQLQVRSQNMQMSLDALVAPTGSTKETVATVIVLPDQLRPAASVSLNSGSLQKASGTQVFGITKIGEGAVIQTDPGANVTLASSRSLEIDGKIIAKAGTISANLQEDPNLTAESTADPHRIHLGANALLDASGVAKVYQNSSGLNNGDVLSGGIVKLTSSSYVSAEKGSVIDVRGATPVQLDILNVNGGLGQNVGSDGGSVNISVSSGAYLDNTFHAEAGSNTNKGGSFSLAFTTPASGQTMHVGEYNNKLTPDSIPAAGQKNQAYANLPNLVKAGFDNIALTSGDKIRFEGDFAAGLDVPISIQSFQFNAPTFQSDGGYAQLQANIVKFSQGNSLVNSAMPVLGNGNLSVKANLIELTGNTSFAGFAKRDEQGAGLTFNSVGEFRLTGQKNSATLLQKGLLNTASDIDITAGVVTPSTLTDYTVNTTGDVNFYANGTPGTPISALGKLTVTADNINQSGSIVAPFGTVTLTATNQLTLGHGSVTSVAAAANAVLPLGQTSNGNTYFIANGDKVAVDANTLKSLPTKTIVLAGKTVNQQAGSKLDISGGGDMQAWEFSAGPGGSVDVLAKDGYYAIVPGYQGIASPSDPQDDGNQAGLGQRVYLSGGNGIPAGFYTLMPAHYALLPGAFAVKTTGGVADLLPANNYIKQDGTSVVAGFLTDSRQTQTNPGSARWTGFEVLSRDQVKQYSEYKLTNASTFFANNATSSLPNDAGLLQIKTQTALTLAGEVSTAAANGGRGASVDISADKLALVDGTPAASDEVALDISSLNKLKAESLIIGGLRTKNSDGTTSVAVTANTVRMDGKSASPLTGNEIILTATNNVSLENDSKIVADGKVGSTNTYNVSGNHALLRVAATDAKVVSKTAVDGTTGSILAGANTQIVSSNSIAFDATKDTDLKGKVSFEKDGKSVNGNLALAASKINIGDAVPSNVTGLVFNQQALNTFGSLDGLHLHSYSTFDFYGNSTLGQVDGAGKYSLGAVSFESAGLSGKGSANDVVNINASVITLANPDNSVAVASSGQGQLNLNSSQLILGAGAKQISGFNQTNVKSTEVIGQGVGSLKVSGDVNVNTARISGDTGASQTIDAIGNLEVQQAIAAATLAATSAMGADWKLSGANVNFNTNLESHGGNVVLEANKGALATGNVTLGDQANIDVSGKSVVFFDKTSNAPAGKITITSTQGNVTANEGAKINVSAAAGGNAGSLTVNAIKGTANIAAANLSGTNVADAKGNQGTGASFAVDTNAIADFDALNKKLNDGGFEESRDVRLRSGDLSVTQAGTGAIKSHSVAIAVDAGTLNVDTTVDASGSKGGNIDLYARDKVTLASNANLIANATIVGEKGGKVTIGTGDNGSLNLQAGKINVANSAGGDSGQLVLRAPQTASADGVASSVVNTDIQGVASIDFNAVRVYDNVKTITASADGSAGNLGIDKVLDDKQNFMQNKASIISALGAKIAALGNKFHLHHEAEVRSPAEITVKDDIDFYQENRVGDDPGVLTLRAAGDINVKGSISDGFDAKDRLATNNSWSYRLVAGADQNSINPIITNSGTGNFSLYENKLIRTGTGDIQIAAGGNFDLGKSASGQANQQTSVIYTAGKEAPNVVGYYGVRNAEELQDADGNTQYDENGNPLTIVKDFTPQFAFQGGSITLDVKGNINGAKTNQLYVDWLYRVGKTDADGKFTSSVSNPFYLQTAWWVDHSQFQQGIATFGGGEINVNAGGSVQDLSLSAVTNGRMASDTPDATKLVITGGGDIQVKTGGDIGGGSYYVEQGTLGLNAQGAIGFGSKVNGKDYYPVIALGNATADLFARQDANIQTVLNPMSIKQPDTVLQSMLLKFSFLDPGTHDAETSFTTYGDKTALNMTSLSGDANVNNYLQGVQNNPAAGIVGVAGVAEAFAQKDSGILDALSFAGTVKASAFQGNVNVSGSDPIVLSPQANGQLELLANKSVNMVNSKQLGMSDRPLSSIPFASAAPSVDGSELKINYLTDYKTYPSDLPLHLKDDQPVRIYAVNGDIKQTTAELNALYLVKQARVMAGQDIINPNIVGQNINADDVTYLRAGRDIVSQTSSISNSNEIRLNGPGILELEAGRNIDFGLSKGIQTQGNAFNPSLPDGGASVRIAAGVLNGVDYTGAINRLIAALSTGNTLSDSILWQARWLLAKDNANYASLGSKTNPRELLDGVISVRNMSVSLQEDRVRSMFYQALRDTGRDHNDSSSPYYGEYTRGYDTTELLFPGINEKNADGSSKNYTGSLNIATSRIKTTDGGDVEFMVPGGAYLGGLQQISNDILSDAKAGLSNTTDLGIVVVDKGSVRGFVQDSMVVNQSRILTTGGGDIMLWASNGDIDAGKGKKTSVSIPPPVITISNGVVTVTQQGAATGSGIGALGGFPAPKSSVDLIAPKGTVNAGDAGIRAGNLNIAAAVVLGADNITASGSTSGVPVTDTSALSGSLSSASGVGGNTSKDVADQVSKNAQKQAENAFAKKPSPSFINVEVVSIGE